MNSQKTIFHPLLRWAVPVWAGTGFALAATPSFAATFAYSEASVDIFNISHQPTSIFTSSQTNTFTQAGIVPEPTYFESLRPSIDFRAESEARAVAFGENTNTDTFADSIATDTDSFSDANSFSISSSDNSAVQAQAESTTYFDATSPFAINAIATEVFGQGSRYRGISQAQSTILGNFSISESEVFSFDFGVSSLLAALVDRPSYETAKATADVSFVLFGGETEENQQIFDFFTFSSQLSPTQSSYLADYSSDSFAVNISPDTSDPTVNSFEILGSYQRSFTTPTYLTLVEVKRTQADANVPEPLSLVGAGVASVLGATFKRKLSRKK